MGDVYICGDLNSRTGSLPDFVEEIGLDRFVDLPDSDEQSTSIPIRQSFDSIVNAFGHKLISLCKENDLKILNGCLGPGRSKRKTMNRNWCNQKANPALNTKAGNK